MTGSRHDLMHIASRFTTLLHFNKSLCHKIMTTFKSYMKDCQNIVQAAYMHSSYFNNLHSWLLWVIFHLLLLCLVQHCLEPRIIIYTNKEDSKQIQHKSKNMTIRAPNIWLILYSNFNQLKCNDCWSSWNAKQIKFNSIRIYSCNPLRNLGIAEQLCCQLAARLSVSLLWQQYF